MHKMLRSAPHVRFDGSLNHPPTVAPLYPLLHNIAHKMSTRSIENSNHIAVKARRAYVRSLTDLSDRISLKIKVILGECAFMSLFFPWVAGTHSAKLSQNEEKGRPCATCQTHGPGVLAEGQYRRRNISKSHKSRSQPIFAMLTSIIDNVILKSRFGRTSASTLADNRANILWELNRAYIICPIKPIAITSWI